MNFSLMSLSCQARAIALKPWTSGISSAFMWMSPVAESAWQLIIRDEAKS